MANPFKCEKLLVYNYVDLTSNKCIILKTWISSIKAQNIYTCVDFLLFFLLHPFFISLGIYLTVIYGVVNIFHFWAIVCFKGHTLRT